MDRANAAVTAILAAAVVGVGVYFYANRPPATVPATPAPTATPPPAEPAIKHPIPDATDRPPITLGDSDASALAELQRLFGDAVGGIVLRENLVRRIVATVDSLPRSQTSLSVLPVKPIPGMFLAEGDETSRTIAEKNAQRYAPYVELVERADTKAIVETYIRHYPLFQEAYVELGYPKGYFNDRLIEAIDDLLAAPEIASPPLVQPKALYLYADPDLERRSSGQKILIRMGPANAARVKAKLGEIRAALAAASAAPDAPSEIRTP